MFEAYKIGIRISLINGASLGLAALSRNFLSTGAQAAKLQARISSIQKQMKAGLLIGGAGAAMVGVFAVPLEEAKKFQTEVARFQSLGFGDQVTDQAVKFARGMKTIGTSARDNMALVGDAMAVFKNLEHAEFAAPIMAKMKFSNEALYGAEAGGANERKFMDMLKVIEFRGGLSSQKEFATQADYVQKVIAGSRNRVDATALLQALKTGGVALSRRGNEQFYLGSEPLIQEFGGSRYGTAAMSIYQNLVQARGTIPAQQELYRLGLLDASHGKVQFNSEGRLKKALAGSFKGSAILENEGELALLEKVLLPAFAAKGITGDEAIIREFGMILGNRTGSGLMARIYQQRAQIHVQEAANRNALGIAGMAAAGNKTLAGKEIDYHAKFNDLMLNLGNVVLPIAVKALEKLLPMMSWLANAMMKHTTITKILVGGFIGLGIAMSIGGTLLLVTAGFRGLGLALAFNAVGGFAGLLRLASGLRMFASAAALSAVGGTPGLLGIGKSLTSMAGAMGLLTQAAGVFMAAYLGWKAGGLLNDYVINPGIKKLSKGKYESLGGWIYGDADAKYGASGARGQHDLRYESYVDGKWVPKAGGDYIRGKQNQTVQVNSAVYLDSRKVGEAVTQHQVKAATKPQTGVSGFDSSQHAPPIGLTSGF